MNESHDPLLKEWENDLHRIIRRNSIKRELKNGDSLYGIKKNTREFEKIYETRGTIEKLTEEEFSIDEKKKEVAENLFEHLVNKGFDREGFSIVLLGSSIHGGAKIRKLIMGESDQADQASDFDFGILANEMDGEFAGKIMEEAKTFLRNETSYKHCAFMNPNYLRTTNIKSTEEAAEILRESGAKRHGIYSSIILFFEPSFPEETNINNRKLILEALTSIYNIDRNLWRKIVNEIIRIWKEIHRLEPNHLINESEGNYKLEKKVHRDSGMHMLEIMHELLESTAIENN